MVFGFDLSGIVNVDGTAMSSVQLFTYKSIDNTPCLDSLLDSYMFITSSLKNELAEVRAVHSGYLFPIASRFKINFVAMIIRYGQRKYHPPK